MGRRILAEGMVLILPFLVYALHKTWPGNPVTPYFLPRYLAERKYPKARLRQAGAGFCFLAVWCFAVVYVTTDLLRRGVERAPVLMAVLYFILPLGTLLSLVLGTNYLVRGLFGRGDAVRPGVESLGAAERDQLPRYIHKLKVYNGLNLLALLLLIAVIPVEAALGIGERGGPVLFNVSLLITFLLTLWRIRFYLVKAAMLMDLSADKVLRTTLGSPLGIFFVWVHSILILRKFHAQNNEK